MFNNQGAGFNLWARNCLPLKLFKNILLIASFPHKLADLTEIRVSASHSEVRTVEGKTDKELERKLNCLCVIQPMALSSLILNHETIAHDTLLCSAHIWRFTVSTEI